jgi:hypothetical protein
LKLWSVGYESKGEAGNEANVVVAPVFGKWDLDVNTFLKARDNIDSDVKAKVIWSTDPISEELGRYKFYYKAKDIAGVFGKNQMNNVADTGAVMIPTDERESKCVSTTTSYTNKIDTNRAVDMSKLGVWSVAYSLHDKACIFGQGGGNNHATKTPTTKVADAPPPSISCTEGSCDELSFDCDQDCGGMVAELAADYT